MTPEEINKKAYEKYPVAMDQRTDSLGFGDFNAPPRQGYIEAYKELDFSPATDGWDAYRREAAKDILCALLQKDGSRGYAWWTIEQAAQTAVKQADSLIEKLQGK